MIYRIPAFRGIDQSVGENLLESCDSPDAQNMDTQDGMLQVAAGFTRLTPQPVPAPVRSMFTGFRRLEGEDGAHLFAATDDAVYELRDGAWAKVLENTGGGDFQAINYQKGDDDVLLCVNGANAYRWDGAAFTRWTSCPERFRLLTLFVERVWGSGIAHQPDAVYWSEAYNADGWQPNLDMPEAGGGFVLIPTWNGGRILAMQPIFNDIVVFKQEDIFRIVGTYPGDYEILRVHGVVGPIAPRTVVSTGTVCYFLGKDGLCGYDGVSAQALPEQRARKFLRNLDPAYVQRACAAVHGDTLYIAVPEKGFDHNNAVLEMNLHDRRVMIRRGFRVDAFHVWRDRLLFSDDTGNIYAYGEGDDYDGRPIEAYWRTGYGHSGTLDGTKYGLSVITSGEGGWLEIEHRTERMAKAKALCLSPGRRARVRLLNKGRRGCLVLRNLAGSRFKLDAGVEWIIESEGV